MSNSKTTARLSAHVYSHIVCALDFDCVEAVKATGQW
ncbi:hypothetical protein BIW11_03927 [Tropilaelaps mercedesae]|uniref:Uncharacterized protein n=1 Tax=Tropilaelaps mercedesae TaxID=418985 RepID=A0A1V9XDS9_9ACAR|nr:hypothetical protein BIW11_03927 [Tropilaelaps mercedesae]